MATIVQASVVIPFTPSGAKSRGDVVVTVSRLGVVMRDVAANAAGELCVEGVVIFPKATSGGSAIPDGTKVYWNAGSSILSITSTDGLAIGTTIGASADADATQSARLLTGGAASTAQAAYVAPLTDNSGGATADGTIGAVTAPSALTDNTTGSASTTLASISDAATKNAIASLAARQAENRTAIIALTDAVKEVSVKIAAILTAVQNSGSMAAS